MDIRVCGVLVLFFSAVVMAQQSEETTIVTKTTETGYDLVSPLYMEDVTPVADGGLELRFRFEWLTDDYADIDGDDDFTLGAGVYWGFAPNWEMSFALPFNVGDGDADADGVRGFDGDGDLTFGLLWRFAEQSGYVPAMALQTKFRIDTGYRSSDCDAEARLILTNEYDSGLRSHINVGFETNDGDWHRLPMIGVVGMDGPLCAGGAVRWIADYVHMNSEYLNGGNSNILELGTEWRITEGHKLGMMGQFGLDDHDETPDFGARVIYSLSIL